MNIPNPNKMTTSLILLFGILVTSCGIQEKSKPQSTDQENQSPEQVASSRETVREGTNNVRSAGEINLSGEIVDKNQPKFKNKETQSTTTNPHLIAKKTETEAVAAAQPIVNINSGGMVIDHSAWDQLLKKYVDEKGNVDYKSFQKDKQALVNYLDFLAQNSPKANEDKKERLAYYINLYNAATVKLILDNYPTNSIKDIRSPWDKKWVKVGEKELSLGHIEHKILRKMDEPRIHFAINCASYSCPKLLNEAFTASNMETLLQESTRDFINDPTRNIITSGRLRLSNIFKWYKKDFTLDGTLIEYINPYSEQSIASDAKINYLKYDWSLNERK